MCILDIVLSVVGTIKGFESFETFFECVGTVGLTCRFGIIAALSLRAIMPVT